MDLSVCESNCGLVFANFNQDFGCFVAVTSRGFNIFNSDPLRLKEKRLFVRDEAGHLNLDSETDEPVILDSTLEAVVEGKARIIKAEMLFRCNYVALVIEPTHDTSLCQGHKVVIWDDLKRRGIIHLEFNSEVRAVRLRRDRVVVVLTNLIKVYTFTSSPQQLHVFDTCPNPRGLCSLSPSSTNSLLAFPAEASSSSTGGKVQIVDLANTEKQPLIVAAHETKLSCITLNIQGSLLATSSSKGTLIRVFDAQNGQLLTELRRGSQAATIYSINFSADSTLLCASSSHGTIHVFSVCDPSKNKQSSLASWSLSSATANKFLPKYFTSEWSFSRIEVPGATKCICAFTPTSQPSPSSSNVANFPSIFAVCADGSYHKFIYDEMKRSYQRDIYQMFLESAS